MCSIPPLRFHVIPKSLSIAEQSLFFCLHKHICIEARPGSQVKSAHGYIHSMKLLVAYLSKAGRHRDSAYAHSQSQGGSKSVLSGGSVNVKLQKEDNAQVRC